MSGFTAPTGSFESKKLEVEKIPSGMQLCTFYGLADLGTQETNFGQKRMCGLHFEFPQQMRIFFEGEEPRPSAIYREMTLSMHEKAGLRNKFVEPMIGKKLTDEEAAQFDISTLLGKHFVATIADSPCGKYANMVSITPLTEQNMLMFGLNNINVPQINKTYFFHLTMGFESENFKNLPKFIREKLKNSPEGKEFLNKGGVFNEPTKEDFSKTKKIIILPHSEYTYEQFIQGGWSDEQIVEQGYGKWEEITSVPLEKKELPEMQKIKSTPNIPQKPTVPSPLEKKEERIKMKNPQHILEDWIREGWTEEALVKEGYAVFVNGASPLKTPHSNDDIPF